MSRGTPGPEGETRRPTQDTDTNPQPTVGQRIGPFRLVRLIGQGATGRVFEVQHQGIGRRAAMKILAAEHATRPGAVKRLLAEAQAVSTISHPHIVQVTDLIEADGPEAVNAIVMELLEGESLAHAIHQSGRMPPARFIPILAQVADALAAAHACRLVHRDLKPENVFLITVGGQRDFVKLLDFGLAKTITQGVGLDPWARPPVRSDEPAGAQVFVGTPAYASPEQAAGRSVDHRTDIYSLGVILYELLCGRLPFEGRNFSEYVVKHMTAPPPAAPAEVMRTQLGRTLDAVARRCLAKEPQGRFDSAAELRTIFQRLEAGDLDIPGVVVAGSPPVRWGLWLGLLLVVAGAFAGWRAVGARVRRAETPLAVSHAPGPAIVPLPAPPDQPSVSLSFVSQPPGAEVRRVDTGELVGVTPFERKVKATGAEVEYDVRLPGYTPRRERVTLTADPHPRTVGGPLHRAPASRRRSRNATLNPFSR
jgi:tRNA A-37 threonylcarbamoyl transferase component Bud32